MNLVDPLNKSAPLAPRVVRVTTAVVTILALAGAVATATLIFAVGLSVLWPVLIACACLTVLCAVGFLIAHCIIAGGKTPSAPIEHVDIAHAHFRKAVKTYATSLDAMPKNTPLSDALRTLGKKKGILISGDDITTICDHIARLVAKKIGSEISNLTLDGLSSAYANEIRNFYYFYSKIENLSNYLPITIAILSLISNSRFSIVQKKDKYQIWSLATDKKYSDSIKNYIGNNAYSVFNYGNSESAPGEQQEITRKIAERIGRDNVFVTHYDGNGTLVIDPSPQVESQDESAPTFE